MRMPRGTISSMNSWALPESRTWPTRSSVERMAREARELTTMAMVKNEAILIPSGRSWTLTTNV